MIELHSMISAEKLDARVTALAAEAAAIIPKNAMVVGLLKGAFLFTADMVRALGRLGHTPEIDFMRISSYGKAKTSSGEVLLSGRAPDVSGRHVLLLDDILDTGRSLAYARDLFLEHGATAVTSCVLLDKPARRAVPIEADLVGFRIEDQFVVGYGIDYAENYRYLPYIGYVTGA